MAPTAVVIRGTDKVIGKLQSIPARLAKKVLRQAMRSALKPVLAEAKANAPRRTGALVRSLKLKAAKRKKDRIGINVVSAASDSGRYHSAFVEFGLPSRHQEGQHFLERAYEDQGENAKATVLNLIAAGLDSVVKEK